MSLISGWFSTTLAFATDDQNTPEVNLLDSFEAIEIDIPVIEAAELQIKGSNSSGGTFDLIGLEEPIPSSTGNFRTTVPLGGKYQYIKVYLSAAQSSDRIFAVRGISYASAGLVVLIDRVKQLLTGIVLAAGTNLIGWFRRRRVPVFTRSTGTNTAIATLNPAADFHLLGIRLFIGSALAAAETLTVTLDANEGAAYDTVLFTLDMGTPDIRSVVIPFGGDEDFFVNGDKIVVALSANTGGDTWGCEIMHELMS